MLIDVRNTIATLDRLRSDIGLDAPPVTPETP
jgi:hypothetical protein